MSDPINSTPRQAIRHILGQVRQQVSGLDRIDRARLVEDLIRSAYEFSKTRSSEGEGPDGRDGQERRGLAQLVDAATHHTYELAAALGVQVPLAQPRRDLATEVAGLCPTLTGPQRARLVEDVVRVVYDYVKFHDPEGEGLDGRNGPERRGLGQLVDEATAHRIAMIRSERPDLSSSSGPEGTDGGQARDLMAEIALSLSDPTEAHQQAVRRHLPGDDNAVELTVLQAQKCLSVVSAYLDDHAGDDDSLWADPVRKVIQLLSVRAMTAQGITRTSTDPWPELDALALAAAQRTPPPSMTPSFAGRGSTRTAADPAAPTTSHLLGERGNDLQRRDRPRRRPALSPVNPKPDPGVRQGEFRALDHRAVQGSRTGAPVRHG